MCRDCNICGPHPKMSKQEAVNRALVVHLGKDIGDAHHLVKCTVCGCSWISDVGGFPQGDSHSGGEG